MIGALMTTAVRRFGLRYDYDTAYLQQIIDADTGGGLRLLAGMSYLKRDFGAPAAAYFGAKLRSVMRADCGPCLRLTIAMARENGVPHHDMLAATGNGRGSDDCAFGVRYADVVLDNSADLVNVLEEAASRYGEKGRLGLATATLAGQFYPLLKRGTGHGLSCEPVLQTLRDEWSRTETVDEPD